MKISRGDILFSAYLGLFAMWVLKNYQHYFGLGLANGVVIIATFLVPFLIFSFYQDRFGESIWIVIALSLLPIILVPIVRYSMVNWVNSWFVIYALIPISGLSLIVAKNWKLLILPVVCGVTAWILPFEFLEGQKNYKDLLISSTVTEKGVLDITSWKGDHWIYFNQELIETTVDRHMSNEAFAHPGMSLGLARRVLVLGNETGGLLLELLKYDKIEKIDYVPADLMVFEKLMSLNLSGNLKDERLEKIDDEPLSYLKSSLKKYDLVYIDIPIEKNFDGFRDAGLRLLEPNGLLVFQKRHGAKIPNTTTEVSREFGFLTYTTHVPTIGFYSWKMYAKNWDMRIDKKIKNATPQVPTKWWNQQAMSMMLGDSDQYKSQRPSR